MSLFLIFILGLFIGSFLNVLIDRIPRNESIIKGRSHCEHCRRKLAWYDLIPVLSYIFLDGKCRYCRVPISFYYPIIELVTGLIFALVFSYVKQNNFPFIYNFQFFDLSSGLMFITFYYFFIASALIVVFFTDLKYGIIPDKIVFPSILVSLLYLILNTKYFILSSLLSAIGAFAFFFLLFFVTRGKGMGFGDVKFVFLMGLILGFPFTILGLYVAFLSGALISVILIILKKKKLAGSTIPFGPFLVLGTVVSLFYGEILLNKFMPFLLGGL